MTTRRLLAVLCAMFWTCTFAFTANGQATQPSTKPATKFIDVDPAKFQELSKQPDTVILDVRTPEEYAAGHIAGSVLIDIRNPDFAKRIAELDKSKTYLVHCRSGVRSVTACNSLGDLGFSKLYNLVGGINAWQSGGKPVEK